MAMVRPGRTLAMLEGGYDLGALADGAIATMERLAAAG